MGPNSHALFGLPSFRACLQPKVSESVLFARIPICPTPRELVNVGRCLIGSWISTVLRGPSYRAEFLRTTSKIDQPVSLSASRMRQSAVDEGSSPCACFLFTLSTADSLCDAHKLFRDTRSKEHRAALACALYSQLPKPILPTSRLAGYRSSKEHALASQEATT